MQRANVFLSKQSFFFSPYMILVYGTAAADNKNYLVTNLAYGLEEEAEAHRQAASA